MTAKKTTEILSEIYASLDSKCYFSISVLKYSTLISKGIKLISAYSVEYNVIINALLSPIQAELYLS